MAIFLAKITDMLGSFAASLQLSVFLPATLLVGALVWLLIPSAISNGIWFLIFAGGMSIVVSYSLHAFNMPLIRAFEGYILANSPPISLLKKHQVAKLNRHHSRIGEYQKKARAVFDLENDLQFQRALTADQLSILRAWRHTWDDRMAHEQERLRERFPPDADRVMATGLGNTIAAFELYSQQRYGIDIGQLWVRLVPTLLEKKYSGVIESEKAILDFFVNILAISALVWPISLLVFAATGRWDAGLLLILLPLLTVIVYGGACVAASNWGIAVNSSFDLYRHELAKALKLPYMNCTDLAGERRMWQGISEFFATGGVAGFDGFDYDAIRKDQKL